MNLPVISPMFKRESTNRILNFIYTPGLKILNEKYKALIRMNMELEGKDIANLSMHYVTLDADFHWVGGAFKTALPYGLPPKTINRELRSNLRLLNRERVTQIIEKSKINTYLVAVFNTIQTMKDAELLLPSVVRDNIDLAHMYPEGERNIYAPVYNVCDEYILMIKKRLVLNLITAQ